jgi:hypothetical protein
MPSSPEKKAEQARWRRERMTEADRERAREYAREYYAKNPEKRRAWSMKFRETHPDYASEYWRTHRRPARPRRPAQSRPDFWEDTVIECTMCHALYDVAMVNFDMALLAQQKAEELAAAREKAA